MKGIVLVGGNGSRLYPLTAAYSKHLLIVYDKPLVYYPIATLMLSGIRDILIIGRRQDEPLFRQVLGTGEQWGIRIQYAIQDQASGVAEALLIGRSFVGGDRVALVLGDNIFIGHGLRSFLQQAQRTARGATIFAYWVSDPRQFGVVEFDAAGNVIGLQEKPANPRSNYAVPGLYFYDERASDFAAALRPSARGELEITDVNRRYLATGELTALRLERGFAWLDAGAPESLLEAASFVASIERRQGLKVACIEEIAWRLGWIDDPQLERLADRAGNSTYGSYLRRLREGH